jgi:hypothetical protein
MKTPDDFEATQPDISYPEPPPIWHDFSDSISSVHREDEAVARRRSTALKHALRARGLSSDPGGSNFFAARARAISARRLANAEIELFRDSLSPVSVSSGPMLGEASLAPRLPAWITPLRPYAAPVLVALVVLSGVWILGPFVAAAKIYFEER